MHAIDPPFAHKTGVEVDDLATRAAFPARDALAGRLPIFPDRMIVDRVEKLAIHRHALPRLR